MIIYGDAFERLEEIKDNSIDHVITDSPFGIEFGELKKTYNRSNSQVIKGYREWTVVDYERNWYQLFGEYGEKSPLLRVLKPNANIIIFSSWTNLPYLFYAMQRTDFSYNTQYQHHIIWKYQFGVHTNSIITSHYHILWFRNLIGTKSNSKPIFNQFAVYDKDDKDEMGRKLHYLDRESVWYIKRPYKTGKTRYKTELPPKLCEKLVKYFTREGDIILDLFAGSGRIAQAAQKLNRRHVSIESNKEVIPYMANNIWGINIGPWDGNPYIIDHNNLKDEVIKYERKN